jgi:hypothetical protein
MKTEFKFAIIYAVASFAWSCVEYFSGLQSSRIALHPYFVTPFYILLTGIVYYLAVREKRALSGGKIRFGKAFLSGFFLTVLIVILHLVPFYIFNTFINPAFFPELARQAVESGKMESAAADAYFGFHNMLIQGSIYRAVMGVAASLITALTMRRA